MQDQISRSSRSASPIHSSTEQKTIFVNNYSNVRVVRSITRFDGARLSYALVRSNCNKLVITWPLGRLANLSPSGASRPRVINQPAPSCPCYNYYICTYCTCIHMHILYMYTYAHTVHVYICTYCTCIHMHILYMYTYAHTVHVYIRMHILYMYTYAHTVRTYTYYCAYLLQLSRVKHY